MSTPPKVTMFGMARYADWEAGVSNRQLELLDVLHRHRGVERVLAVDVLPWRLRDVAKATLGIHRPRGGVDVPRYRRPWRRMRQVSSTLYVLSSSAAVNGKPSRQFQLDVAFAQQLLGMERSLLWSYVPTLGRYLSGLPRTKLLFDAVDSWLAHPFYSTQADAIGAGYAAYAAHADVITTVNPTNASLFPGRSVAHVPNGVAVDRYAEQLPVPFDLATLPRPIVGYVGTIQGRLDIDIIRALSAEPKVGSVVLIGPVWYRSLAKQLAALPRVHLLGRQPRWETPAYLQHLDAGLVPHRQTEFVASTEAMKVYEYLAAGLPVVATPGACSHETSRFVREAATPADFVAAVLDVAGPAPDAPQRRAAAARADWSHRLQAILDLV